MRASLRVLWRWGFLPLALWGHSFCSGDTSEPACALGDSGPPPRGHLWPRNTPVVRTGSPFPLRALTARAASAASPPVIRDLPPRAPLSVLLARETRPCPARALGGSGDLQGGRLRPRGASGARLGLGSLQPSRAPAAQAASDGSSMAGGPWCPSLCCCIRPQTTATRFAAIFRPALSGTQGESQPKEE